MIVFDASSIVGAALREDSVPERALLHAMNSNTFALSLAVESEIEQVLRRPKFARSITLTRLEHILLAIRSHAEWFEPTIRVSDCRDDKDNKYLELALASGAAIIVSSDEDLLVLNPWREVQILRPVEYLIFP